RLLRVGHRAVPRPRDQKLVEPVLADVQAAASLRPAEPLLAGSGVVVAAEPADIHRYRPDRLRSVEQHRRACRAQPVDIREPGPRFRRSGRRAARGRGTRTGSRLGQGTASSAPSFYRVATMCFEFDALPPVPPADLLLPRIAGAAGAELLELTSADGTRFSA